VHDARFLLYVYARTSILTVKFLSATKAQPGISGLRVFIIYSVE
jgi:hypothetical protein